MHSDKKTLSCFKFNTPKNIKLFNVRNAAWAAFVFQYLFLGILKNDAVIVKYMENIDEETECWRSWKIYSHCVYALKIILPR